jgi:hypothetical protein
MTILRTALQSRLDRYRSQYRDGRISAAEFRRRLVMLPYVRLDDDQHITTETIAC